MTKHLQRKILAFIVAVLSTAAMILLRWLMDSWLGNQLPFVTLFGAVALAVWFGGYRSALLATGLGYIGCNYLFMWPRHVFKFNDAGDVLGLVLYLVTSSIIILLGEGMRAARRRADEQLEFMRVTFASMGDAVITTDAEGRVTALNPIASLLTGWTQADAAGQPLERIFHIIDEQTRQPAENPARRALEEGIVVGLANHTILIARNGSERAIDDSAAPITTPAGDRRGVVLIFRDVSEHRQAERVARLLAAIIESSDDAIISKDINGIITSWNRSAERIFGYPAHEAVGHPIAMLAPPDRIDEMPAILARIRSGDRVDHYDTVRRHKSGQLIPISLTVSPIRDETGEVVGASKIARDISDRRRAEEALREEKARLQITLHSIGDGVIVTDATGRITMFNPVAQTVTRWADDAIGRPLEDVFRIINEQTRRPVENPVRRALAEGTIVGLANHTVLLAKDGTEVPIDDSAAPIKDAQGHVVGCVLIFRDITQRRKQEGRLSLLWEAASVLLSTVDPDVMLRELFASIAPHLGLDIYLNYMLTEAGDALHLASHLGLTEPEAQSIQCLELGQAICGMVAAQQRAILATHIQQSLDSKTQWGKSVGIRAHVCNPLIGERKLLGTLSFASRSRDMFEPSELEFIETICQYVAVAYERVRFVRQLRIADRRKDEFLATLAHELRNPLAPIRSAVDLLKIKSPTDADVDDLRDIIDRQVRHMTRLVDDLMEASRIAQGKLQVRKERIELAPIVQSAIESARPPIEAAGHELTVTLPTGPVVLYADATRLSQVIANLLTNAAKYTEKGGHIWLTAECHEKQVSISVRDTGIGIAAEYLPHLFEMFSQIEPALERSDGGLGIGLSLVRGLVELHGGTVEARSPGLGEGSEFVIRLPVADEIPVPAPPRPVLPTVSPSVSDGRKRRILVVDDRRDSANGLALLLQIMGHETQTAYDGLEAVQAAATFQPEIVLMDIGLPKMNGYEAARSIREELWGKNMALIALTGWGQEEDRRRALDAGFDHHLTKPVESAALENLLKLIRPESNS